MTGQQPLVEHNWLQLYVESFERLSAVDGLALSQQEIDRFNVSARAARGRKVLPGQVGCALSHARVMSGNDFRNLSSVLVLEDDVTFVPKFLDRLECHVKDSKGLGVTIFR